MKRLRKIIFWCHLAAGVFAGVVILIMSVTGVLLTYERQIIAWADTRGYSSTPPAEGPATLPVETLIAKARETRPAQPATLTLRADAGAPAEVGYGREGVLFLNPYTGEVLGEGSRRTRAFFQSVTDWHRWLGAGGERRAWGRAVTGACNLAFLFIVASGFYLWWPRNWARASLRGVTWFRRGLAGKARDFNWHNVVGFWSAAPLFVVVLSAVVISYTWAGNLVYRVAGEQPPAPRQPPPPQGNAEGRGPQPELAVEGLNGLWARGRAAGGLAQHLAASSDRGRQDRDVHHRRRQRRTAAEARAAHARPAHGRGVEVGAFFAAHARPPIALVPALRAHGRGLRDRGANGSRPRFGGRRAARLDGPLAGVAARARLGASARGERRRSCRECGRGPRRRTARRVGTDA